MHLPEFESGVRFFICNQGKTNEILGFILFIAMFMQLLIIFRLLPKNQIIQKMQTLIEVAEQEKQESSLGSELTYECDPLFDKYRAGVPTLMSAFRLYSTDVSFEEDEFDSEDTPSQKTRGSYRKYTQQEKELAVSKILNGHDVREVSREFGIPRRNLLRWRKNGCERKEGGGRPTDHEMECILHEKIKNRQINGQREIRAAAISISKSENFKASKGWYSKFCRRYKMLTGETLSKN